MLTCGAGAGIRQAAQKAGVVAQTNVAQSVSGLGDGTVTSEDFTKATNTDSLDVRRLVSPRPRLCHWLSAFDAHLARTPTTSQELFAEPTCLLVRVAGQSVKVRLRVLSSTHSAIRGNSVAPCTR